MSAFVLAEQAALPSTFETEFPSGQPFDIDSGAIEHPWRLMERPRGGPPEGLATIIKRMRFERWRSP